MNYFPETPDGTISLRTPLDCWGFMSGLNIIRTFQSFFCMSVAYHVIDSVLSDFSLSEPPQLWRKTWTTSCLDSTSHPASSWRPWTALWATRIPKSRWFSRCTAGPARARTMSASSSQIIFTRRGWTANLCTFSHRSSTFHTRVSWKPTRYDGWN